MLLVDAALQKHVHVGVWGLHVLDLGALATVERCNDIVALNAIHGRQDRWQNG